jgi:pilus assembly protein CpaF
VGLLRRRSAASEIDAVFAGDDRSVLVADDNWDVPVDRDDPVDEAPVESTERTRGRGRSEPEPGTQELSGLSADGFFEQPDLDAERLPAIVEAGPLGPSLLTLKRRARTELSERMGAKLYERNLSEDQLETLIIEELARFLVDEEIELAEWEQNRLCEELINDVLHHGPIEGFLRDPSVSEIMVNSTDAIFVERGGRLYLTEAAFDSEDHLRQVVERISASVGRRIDESSPMVDARLADGSRVNAIIPPLSIDGAMLTVRKFSSEKMTIEDLLEMGTLTRGVGAFLAACVRGRVNILVSGGTGSGKTTLLNVLSSYIPTNERIITIEDAAELNLHQRHVIRLESRPANVEGRGAVEVRDLVRNALRMRPDRIVVGECRGGETLDMLQAMNTGHDGSLTTLHANSPRDALRRVEVMALMGGLELPIRVVREQASSAIELIVHIARLRDGSRRITHISEVTGMEGDVVTLNDIFTFDFSAGLSAEGAFLGTLEPSGVRPEFVTHLEEQGIAVPSSIFTTENVSARGNRW